MSAVVYGLLGVLVSAGFVLAVEFVRSRRRRRDPAKAILGEVQDGPDLEKAIKEGRPE